MGRIVKLIGIVVAAIAALLAAAVVFVTLFLDPNDYKDQITTAVAEATGRTLTLEGDLELSVLPTLRIAVGPASLSNAPGFGNTPFASIEGAELEIALIPLFSERIEISRARLSGLDLNLARNAAGANNWQDLGNANSDADPDPGAGDIDGAPNLSLDIAALDINDARVMWSDATTGEDWVLDDFRLEARDFGQGSAFPLELAFDLAGNAVTVSVDSRMNATLDLAANQYRLADLVVGIAGSGSGWPGGEGEAQLRFDNFVADLNAETLNLENLTLEMLGLTVTGSLSGTDLLGNLGLRGAVAFAPFDPRELMDIFDVAIETADGDVLGAASAQATFNYSTTQIALNDLRLALDDSTLAGRVAVVGDRFDFDLNVDQINIDRYLPPATEDAAAEDEGSVDEIDLPIQPLRNFTARGALAFGSVQFMGLSLSEAAFDLRAGDSRLRLTPSGQMYGGSYTGSIDIEVVSDNAARMTLVQSIDGIDLAPFARDFMDSDMISGRGDVSINVSASGANVGEIRRALNGDVSFAFTDGAWEGTDVWYELRRVRAVTDGNSPPPRPAGPPRTPFSAIAASGAIADSVLTTRDLAATLPFMTVNGAGTVNILTNALDFDLNAAFTDGPAFEEAPGLANLAGASLPLAVTGTLDAPSIRPDFGAVVRQRVQQEVDTRVEEEKEELQDRVRDRLRGLFE